MFRNLDIQLCPSSVLLSDQSNSGKNQENDWEEKLNALTETKNLITNTAVLFSNSIHIQYIYQQIISLFHCIVLIIFICITGIFVYLPNYQWLFSDKTSNFEGKEAKTTFEKRQKP